MRFRIATILNVTNPFTTRYLTYYASVASWSKQVDTVFVVDGHSSEDLLLRASQLFGNLDNVELVKTPETHWGEKGRWHLYQSAHNLDFAINAYASLFDVVFVVGADQVAYPGIRETVERNGDQFLQQRGRWCQFHRSKVLGNQLLRRCDARGVVILPEVRDGMINPLHGWNIVSRGATDFPLDITHRSRFCDPVTGVPKAIYAGTEQAPLARIDAECGSFGHFWYKATQCMGKLRRWDEAIARFFGTAPRRNLELFLLYKLWGISGYYPKHRLQSWPFPPEMNKLIAEFYEVGMLGGAIRTTSSTHNNAVRALRKLLGLERTLRTRQMRTKGYRGLIDLHEWVPVGTRDPKPVNVARAYADQDRFFPIWAKSR